MGTAPQMPFYPGSMVGHFRIMRLLGRGGMGQVFLARDTKLGRKVALKVIHSHNFSSRRAIESFLFEARTTARFNHPHIVTVYAVDEHQGCPYVALEYLEGHSLRERMGDERPGVRETMRIGRAIADALQEAHRLGILHGDLKPENVLIPKDGRVRVVDFGLAAVIETPVQPDRAADSSDAAPLPELTEVDPAQVATLPPTPEMETLGPGLATLPAPPTRAGLRGTPHYMAPEQWLQKKPSGATDIWALGLMLHELVCGRRPYNPHSLLELAAQVTVDRPVPRDGAFQKVPATLADVVFRCLEKDPTRRPSAEEVVAALDELLQPGRPAHSEQRCPFRGLLPFAEQHAGLFFGRDAELDAFLERMREDPVLPVVGATGAGKSSFVQAGVIPRLREQGGLADPDPLRPWLVLRLRPGSEPFRTIAGRLISGETTRGGSAPSFEDAARAPTVSAVQLEDEARLAQELRETPTQLNLRLQQLAEREGCRVLLFVDQLEELYTLVPDETTRDRFMEALCNAADDPQDPVRVIFTLREDFLGRVAAAPAVREALSRVTVIWSPGPEILGEILLRPVEAVGYAYDDPSLVQEMVAAVAGEPTCLPLLQFTGRMLWEHRDRSRRLLCRSAYEAIGGVAGALARHADGVLQGLSPAQVRQVRELMLRLVTPEGTRKVVSRRRLLEGPEDTEAAEAVLDRLIQGRLIAVRKVVGGEGETELELVHESLLRTWDRLARWIEESREELVFLKEVGQAAELWLRRGQREEEAWQGDALHEARRSLERCSTHVPELISNFIEAGIRRERRRLRRRKLLLAALILVPTVVALLFIAKEREATLQKNRAEAQRQQARLRWAEAQREGARAALAQGALLEARAKLRGSLERQDSLLGRTLFWQLAREPLIFARELGDSVYDVAFSPDGNTLAAACQDRSIYLLDTRTASMGILRGHDDQVFTVAFTPDGKHLASAGWSGRIHLWDLRSGGGAPRVLAGHKEAVQRLAVSPDGRLLASASFDHTVRLWEIATRRELRVLRGHKGSVYTVRFSPDGTLLASGSRDGVVRVATVSTGALVHELLGHTRTVGGLAFTPDGKRLASASWDGTIRVWNLANQGRLERVLAGHAANVSGVGFLPDGQQLVSGSWDKTIRLWDLASGRTRRVITGHKGGLYNIAVSPDGRQVASGGWDNAVRLSSLERAAADSGALRVEAGHTGAVYGVAFAPDGKLLATGSMDKTIRLWDVRSGRQRHLLLGHGNAVEGVVFSPDGTLLASGSSDKTVRLWDVKTGTQTLILAGHGAEVTGLAFTSDGKALASGSLDHTVRIWDLAAGGRLLHLLTAHSDAVRSVAFSPDDKLLASVGHDRTVRLFSVRTGRQVRTVGGHEGRLFGVTFSPDGRLLATGGEDRTVRLIDVQSGAVTASRRMDGRVYMLAFHPNGKLLGVPCSDGTARLWKVEDNSVRTLTGHHAEVNFLRFSPDGSLIATTSDDGTLRLYESASGRPYWRSVALLPEPPAVLTHQGWVPLAQTAPAMDTRWSRALAQTARQASISDDGRWLCSLTVDGQLQLWDLRADRQLAARAAAGTRQVVATAGGCAVLTSGGAAVLHTSRDVRALADRASAVAWDHGEILVAGPEHVRSLAADGKLRRTLPGKPGVTALRRSGEALVLGFRDGTIERLAPTGPPLAFESTPSGEVMALALGPRGTLLGGFAGGTVGIWNLDGGSRLHHARLHGAVRHLRVRRGTLFAATELGQHLTLDLGVFQQPYCEVLRQLWRQVPVVWEAGLPVLRPPPRQHSCAP